MVFIQRFFFSEVFPSEREVVRYAEEIYSGGKQLELTVSEHFAQTFRINIFSDLSAIDKCYVNIRISSWKLTTSEVTTLCKTLMKTEGSD